MTSSRARLARSARSERRRIELARDASLGSSGVGERVGGDDGDDGDCGDDGDGGDDGDDGEDGDDGDDRDDGDSGDDSDDDGDRGDDCDDGDNDDDFDDGVDGRRERRPRLMHSSVTGYVLHIWKLSARDNLSYIAKIGGKWSKRDFSYFCRLSHSAFFSIFL